MVRYLPFLISLALGVYALFSCIQTPDEDVPHLPKLAWIVLIVLIPFVGPLTWLLVSRTARRDPGGAQRGGRPPTSYGPPVRQSAPDDDPEFLAWLARQQRRQRSESGSGDRARSDGTDHRTPAAGDDAASRRPQDIVGTSGADGVGDKTDRPGGVSSGESSAESTSGQSSEPAAAARPQDRTDGPDSARPPADGKSGADPSGADGGGQTDASGNEEPDAAGNEPRTRDER